MVVSTERPHFDVLVIGSGPGGEGAAMQAAKLGKKVAMVELMPQIGGSCTHFGTIPSKTLRQMAYLLTTFKCEPLFNGVANRGSVGFADFLQRAREVISSQVQMRETHYDRNGITVINGKATLSDFRTVQIAKENSTMEVVHANHIVLATGSRPYHPPDVDFTHPRIFDSDSILNLNAPHRSVTIYGAGVVGCEYTCIFRALGRKVNLINSRSKLMSFLDDEIIDALSYHLRDQGVIIKHDEAYELIEARDDDVVIQLKSGKKVRSDIILFAIGRTGNSDDLGLDTLGVEVNERGNVIVNSHYQTSVPNIYAVGDLTGFPNLASAAYDQGRFAARHLVDPQVDDSLVKDMPVGIYTSPEISCVGRNERQLTDARIPYEVGHVAFRHLARAQITNQTVGMLKMLFHCHTLEILGIHCFGQNAAEIIHIGQAIMAQKPPINSLKYFINTTFNYPTMAEAYRVAALNGLNRLYKED